MFGYAFRAFHYFKQFNKPRFFFKNEEILLLH